MIALASEASLMLALLLRIEWQGDEQHYVCPSCRANRMHGHLPDCDLAQRIAALHRQRGLDKVKE
jgi:hypothetical protein